MAVTVHLVRHCPQPGLNDFLCGRARDESLDGEGQGAAVRLAEALADELAPVRIETSPRKRAKETATIIGAAADTPVTVTGALDEIDFGDWAGRPFSELDEDVRWRFWNTARDRARPPGGETMHDAVERATNHIQTLADDAEGGTTVICVTHSDIIRGVVAHYLGLALDRILNLEVDPGSVTTLAIDHWGGRLVSLNRCYS